MKDGFRIGARFGDRPTVPHISLHNFDAVALQRIVGAAAKDPYLMTGAQQLLHNVQPEEPTTASDQCAHQLRTPNTVSDSFS
jgi:hypothetical protein